MSVRLAWRKSLNVFMLSLTGLCALLTVSALFFILGYLVWNGGKDLSWSFFTHLPAPVGEEGGGMANAILGSLKLLLLAALFGVPIGLLGGVYLAEFGGRTVPFLVRYTADLMNGVPSIVMGLFVYSVYVAWVGHFSGWAGSIALGLLVIPVVVRTTDDMLKLVPGSLREAAVALGCPMWKMIVTITYRAARTGIITGILLAVARISGETAPLLFTALNNQFWSSNMNAPVASLPVVIFQFALSPYKDWQALAWTGALIITMAVLALSITARALTTTRKQS